MNEPDGLLGSQFGNYRLVRLLGRGGFASVYLGENMYINTLVAVKVLHTEIEHREMERFRLEARTIANLKHPHIVQLIDFGQEHRMPYLVMSYAPHGHLHQLQASVGAFPLPVVVSYVKQIASALQFAHDHKVIHRDIKPENILLDAQDSLLLSDFGIALIVKTAHQASNKGISGTLAYMAPEQTQGHPIPASDQYALGVTAYELLSGARPFNGSLPEIVAQHFSAPPPPLREKLPTLPLSVERVILRSLAKRPEERFPSVSAFAEALEEASGLPGTPQDVSTSFYQATSLVLQEQQSFGGEVAEQTSFFGQGREVEPAHFMNFAHIAHGLVMPPFEAAPTARFSPMADSTVPPNPPFEAAFLPDEAYSQASTLNFSPASPMAFASAETVQSGKSLSTGKRSYKLLSIVLICALLIVSGAVLFVVHSANTHGVTQSALTKQASVEPTDIQQPFITGAKSTPKVEKSATVITRSAAMPTATMKPIRIATATTLAVVPLPTPTTAPMPTATTMPTATPQTCGSFAGYYKLVNKNSGKNLDVMNDALTDSAAIVQFTDNGKADQLWSFVATSGGYCKIVNRNSGSLLNIPGATTTSATQLIQYHDDGGLNSQWKLVAVGNGAYKIVSRLDGQCVDVNQASTSDNGAVIQFPDNGGLNQEWQLVLV